MLLFFIFYFLFFFDFLLVLNNEFLITKKLFFENLNKEINEDAKKANITVKKTIIKPKATPGPA